MNGERADLAKRRRAFDWLYRFWARLKTLRLGLPADAIFEGVADDRLQARLAVYQWAALSVADRRVLDLGHGGGCGGCGGYGQAALDAAGAREVARSIEAEAETGERPKFDRVLAIDDPVGRPALDLSAEGLSRLISRMSPGASLLVVGGAWASAKEVDGPEFALSSLPPELVERFLRCRRFVQLAPPGYRPDWRSRSPARARSQEYRFLEVPAEGELQTLPLDALVIGEAWLLSIPRSARPRGPLRLHVGAGMERMDGWLNVDLLPLPGVDLELDVTKDFVFRDVDAIYAEHFLEHLEILDAIEFLWRARQALSQEGRLRLTTPNLDWVWQTHYQTAGSGAEKLDAALSLNRAFYGWEHRFLWNRETLGRVLEACGFRDLQWPRWGESQVEHLRGLERHERYPDTDDLPHVLVVEASPGDPDPAALERLRYRLQTELVDQMKGWFGVDLEVSTSTPKMGDST